MVDPKILKNLLVDYLTEAIAEVKKISLTNGGREILGDIINRPEDVEIGIDRVGEEILAKLVKKYKIKIHAFSEPDGRDIKTSENPEVYGSIDPFDGSVLYLRGFEHNWYTALSFFDEKLTPICGGVADILNEKLYISALGENYILDTKTGNIKEMIPSKRKSLSEPLVIASYVMSSQYSIKFLDIFSDLLKKLHSKALLYPQGGSFIYSYLASGLIDAYIMFDEPRSEIDPGFLIAKNTGCEVITIDIDGKYKDYEFIPGRQHDKVDLLIATSTPQLRDEIIKYYIKKYGEKYSF
ncbi:MAG: hypothetical protein PHW72_00225 [Candidatus Pacebacteria bacterium]|nr:hypothetical protein [Candidatus Paceibacterota bacterium]